MNGKIKTTGVKHLFCCISNSGRPERKKTTAESPLVTKVAAGLRTTSLFDWTTLPKDLVSEIAVHLNKQAVMRLRCANKKSRDDLDTSETIKRPLTAIRDDLNKK